MSKRSEIVRSCVEQALTEEEMDALLTCGKSIMRRERVEESRNSLLQLMLRDAAVVPFLSVQFPDLVRTLLQYKECESADSSTIVATYKLLYSGFFPLSTMSHIFKNTAVLEYFGALALRPCEAAPDAAAAVSPAARLFALILHVSVAQVPDNAAVVNWHSSEWAQRALAPDVSNTVFDGVLLAVDVCAAFTCGQSHSPDPAVLAAVGRFVGEAVRRGLSRSPRVWRLLAVWAVTLSTANADAKVDTTVAAFCSEVLRTASLETCDCAPCDCDREQSPLCGKQHPLLLAVLSQLAESLSCVDAEESGGGIFHRCREALKHFALLQSRSFVIAERVDSLEAITNALLYDGVASEAADPMFALDFVECFPCTINVLCSSANDVEEEPCVAALDLVCHLLSAQSHVTVGALLSAGIVNAVEENLRDYNNAVVTAALLVLCRLTSVSPETRAHTQYGNCIPLVEKLVSDAAARSDVEAALSTEGENLKVTMTLALQWLTLCSPTLCSEGLLGDVSTLSTAGRSDVAFLRTSLMCLERLASAHPMTASLAVDFDYLFGMTETLASDPHSLSEADAALLSSSLAIMSAVVRAVPPALSFEWIETVQRYFALLTAPGDAASRLTNPELADAVLSALLTTMEVSEESRDFLFDCSAESAAQLAERFSLLTLDLLARQQHSVTAAAPRQHNALSTLFHIVALLPPDNDVLPTVASAVLASLRDVVLAERQGSDLHLPTAELLAMGQAADSVCLRGTAVEAASLLLCHRLHCISHGAGVAAETRDADVAECLTLLQGAQSSVIDAACALVAHGSPETLASPLIVATALLAKAAAADESVARLVTALVGTSQSHSPSVLNALSVLCSVASAEESSCLLQTHFNAVAEALELPSEEDTDDLQPLLRAAALLGCNLRQHHADAFTDAEGDALERIVMSLAEQEEPPGDNRSIDLVDATPLRTFLSQTMTRK